VGFKAGPSEWWQSTNQEDAPLASHPLASGNPPSAVSCQVPPTQVPKAESGRGIFSVLGNKPRPTAVFQGPTWPSCRIIWKALREINVQTPLPAQLRAVPVNFQSF
jgi:hypothetical protein